MIPSAEIPGTAGRLRLSRLPRHHLRPLLSQPSAGEDAARPNPRAAPAAPAAPHAVV